MAAPPAPRAARGPAPSASLLSRSAPRPAAVSHGRRARRGPARLAFVHAAAAESSLIEKVVNAVTVTITRSPLHEGKKQFFLARAGQYDTAATQQKMRQLLEQNKVSWLDADVNFCFKGVDRRCA